MSDGYAVPFAGWVKQRRETLGLTQKEVAHATRCSLSTLRKIEAGLRRPSQQLTRLLARSLEVVADEYPAFEQLAREARLSTPGNSRRVAPVTSPTLKTTDTGRLSSPALSSNNLPAIPTAFIGRHDAIEQVCALLRLEDVRLLTLTGPAGIGKTRLSIQAAAGMLDDFEDGVFFVPLAATTDGEMLLPTVARLFGVRESADRTLAQSLGDRLRRKNMLLLLDNFEQIADAGPLVADLLQSAPRVKVLVTSRLLLDLYGEHEFAVPSLEVPSKAAVTHNSAGRQVSGVDVQALGKYEAVQLFVRRAQAARSDFELTQENAEAVREICSRLDGLPLALELAAAQTRHSSLAVLLSRLERRLDVLTGGPRDLPERQRTLRAAIAWSYDLLDEWEQLFFRRLGVFVGGFSTASAASVAGVEHAAAHELIVALAVKSLAGVERRAAPGERAEDPRYSLLETVREFALERLGEEGEDRATRERHARCFLAMAEEAFAQLAGGDQKLWLDRLEEEYPNMRTALSFFLERAPDEEQAVESLMRLSAALSKYWFIRGSVSEGRGWLEAGLRAQASWVATHDVAEEGATWRARLALRARVSSDTGMMAWYQGEFETSRRYYEESLALGKQLGEKLLIARALNNLGMIASEETHFDGARSYYEEALALAREMEESAGITRLLQNLGVVAHKLDDYGGARNYYEQSLELRRTLGDAQGVAVTVTNLAAVLWRLGDLDGADRLTDEAMQIGTDLGDRRIYSRALIGRGEVALKRRDLAGAGASFRESIRLAEELDTMSTVYEALDGLAALAALSGEAERAARLYGSSDMLRETLNAPRTRTEQGDLDELVAVAREQLGEHTWRSEHAEGRATLLPEAIGRALEVSSND